MTKRTYSLRLLLTIILIILLLLFSGLIIYNNHVAFSMLLKRVYINTQDTVALYQQQIDDHLRQNDIYLYTVITNNADFITVQNTDFQSTSWHNALRRLEKNFQNAISTYDIDCVFCYLPDTDTYVHAYDNTVPASIRTPMKVLISSLLSDSPDSYTSWILLNHDNQYYLMRTVQTRGTYVGIWISLNRLLRVANQSMTESSFFFTSTNGQLLINGESSITLEIPDTSSPLYTISHVNGQKMLSVFQPMECGEYYLVRLIPYSEVSDSSHSLTNAIILVVIGILILWFLLLILLRSFVLKPVFALSLASQQLCHGNLNTYVPTGGQLTEFRQMSEAFNEMVSEIKNLKIDVYERRLYNQQLEVQYLKQQITPHFMINCLNTTYQLVEGSHTDLARKMLRSLSQHIRYTLSSGHTVLLGEEIRLTENYIHLSQIRYPHSLMLILECPEQYYRATAIPLLLLNFVENAIKYQINPGQILQIHITVTVNQEESPPRLHICIWDNGTGFSERSMGYLKLLKTDTFNDSSHIGIMNVYLRAKHIYKDVFFDFSNRPEAGAQIDIDLPYIPFV